MIGMIGHLGQVSPRRGKACAFLYVLGAIVGGTAIGAALGLLGTGLRAAAVVLPDGLPRLGEGWRGLGIGAGLAALALLCGLREWGIVSFPLPQRRCQVPRAWWYTKGTRRASFFWGLVIGAGFLTWVTYPVYYVVLALALTGTPLHGGLLMATYGLGQGLVLLAGTFRLIRDASTDGDEGAWGQRMHRLAGGAALAFGACLLASLRLP